MSAASSGTSVPSAVALAVGTVVELVDNLVAADSDRLRAYRILGRRPEGSVNGVDYYGVFTGERAQVIAHEGEGVQIQVLSGNWKGRRGWVAREGVRLRPTDAESASDVIEGLGLNERREIYAASHAAGMKAVETANSRYAFDRMPAEDEGARKYLDERETAYQAAKATGRRAVLERYSIDADQLGQIEGEGEKMKWPVWDGLEDEHGPIPVFGPAHTDERGRIDMTESEWEARREAAIRALKAVGEITDETDTDERWDEALRGMEGAN